MVAATWARGNSSDDAPEPAIRGLGGRQGDLLLKNDANERGEAWASSPERWWSPSLDDASKVTITSRKRANTSKERGWGELSR